MIIPHLSQYDSPFLTKINTGLGSVTTPTSTSYDAYITANLKISSLFPTYIGRKPADRETLTYNNADIWSRTISFLFTPNQITPNVTVFSLYSAVLGDWSKTGNGGAGCGHGTANRTNVYYDGLAYHDINVVTVLEQPYTPNPDMFDGFEYNFVFTRN